MNDSVKELQAEIENELLDGEKVLYKKTTNFLVNPSDYKFKKMSISIKKEALGGMLYLTNYRIIFKSHNFNRLIGTFSILLPDVQEVTNTSRFLMRKLEILTKGLDKFEFVIRNVP